MPSKDERIESMRETVRMHYELILSMTDNGTKDPGFLYKNIVTFAYRLMYVGAMNDALDYLVKLPKSYATTQLAIQMNEDQLFCIIASDLANKLVENRIILPALDFRPTQAVGVA